MAFAETTRTERPLRVLLVEDNVHDAELILAQLRNGGFAVECERVDRAETFATQLEASWDIVLADYSLPQFGALQALRVLQEHGAATPFIVISGSIGDEQAVECLRRGAADYLLKDRLARLPASVRAVLATRERGAAAPD